MLHRQQKNSFIRKADFIFFSHTNTFDNDCICVATLLAIFIQGHCQSLLFFAVYNTGIITDNDNFYLFIFFLEGFKWNFFDDCFGFYFFSIEEEFNSVLEFFKALFALFELKAFLNFLCHKLFFFLIFNIIYFSFFYFFFFHERAFLENFCRKKFH